MTDPVIRLVQPNDVDEVVRLCAEHARYEQAVFSPEGRREQLALALFAKARRFWCFVAESDHKVVAYATCTISFQFALRFGRHSGAIQMWVNLFSHMHGFRF
jgi:hypothetical protein